MRCGPPCAPVYGDPDVVELVDLPSPGIGPGIGAGPGRGGGRQLSRRAADRQPVPGLRPASLHPRQRVRRRGAGGSRRCHLLLAGRPRLRHGHGRGVRRGGRRLPHLDHAHPRRHRGPPRRRLRRGPPNRIPRPSLRRRRSTRGGGGGTGRRRRGRRGRRPARFGSRRQRDRRGLVEPRNCRVAEAYGASPPDQSQVGRPAATTQGRAAVAVPM